MKKGKSFLMIIFFCLVLGSVLYLGYYIFGTDSLQPSVNELTMSYISFQNKNATDMFKITNLKKMSEKKGISEKNSCSFPLSLTGNKHTKYQIVLYPLTNVIEDEYLWYSLEGKNVSQRNSLDQLSTLEDGGKIIYQGKLGGSNTFTYRMWIDKEYPNKVLETSFEIKMKEVHS